MPVVVPKEKVLTLGGATLLASLHGLGTNIGFRWTFVHAPSLPISAEDIVRMALITLLLVATPVALLYGRLPPVRMVAYCAAYTVNLVFWNSLFRSCQLYLDLQIPLIFRPGLSADYVLPSNVLVIGLVGSWLGWGLARWRNGPIVVQDGTRCPGCAYSLVGSVDRICPECGREFTYQELGTTKEELDARAEDPAEHLHLP